MNLFHESENKYYELLSYLLNEGKVFSDKEVIKYLDSELGDSHDYDIEDALFEQKPNRATVFTYAEGKYRPVVEKHLDLFLKTRMQNTSFHMPF